MPGAGLSAAVERAFQVLHGLVQGVRSRALGPGQQRLRVALAANPGLQLPTRQARIVRRAGGEQGF